MLQITAEPFPPEIRVVKECIALRDAGYVTAVLCPPIEGRSTWETWRGIEVFRPDTLRGATHLVDRLMDQTAFLSPSWYRAIRSIIETYRPHVLHVHDIWLGRTAFFARRGQQIVMDLHENMPAAVGEYLRGYGGFRKVFNATFKNRTRLLWYERSLLTSCDLVLAVVEEAASRIRDAHPDLDPSKVVNVENLESREFLAVPLAEEHFISDDHFSILYIGGFGPHRGIDTAIRAMGHIKEWDINARLYLVGAKESPYLRTLRALIHELDVGRYVHVVDWVEPDQVVDYIRQASIGTVPHHSNRHTDNTIPHKLFQYMMAETPVLVSSSPPLARTVCAANSGLVFNAGDEWDCAKCIRQLYDNPELRKRFAQNGFRYVMAAGHNWEEQSAPRLIAAYDELLGITSSQSIGV